MRNLKKPVRYIVIYLGLVFHVQICEAQNKACSDSLQTVLYSSLAFKATNAFQNMSSVSTTDGGNIYFFNNNGNNTDTLVIFRISSKGKVVWGKILKENTSTYYWTFYNIYELKNGNFIMSAGISYIGNNTGIALSSLLQLDQNGNVIWQHVYNDFGLQIGNSAGNAIGQITEGQNGEFIVTGFDSVKGLLINRFDSNGNIIVSNGYNLSELSISASPNGIYYRNSKIYIGGGFENYQISGNSNGVWMLELDYQTGKVNNYAFYDLAHAAPYCDDLSYSGYNGDGAFSLTRENTFIYSRLLKYTQSCGTGNFLIARLDSNFRTIDDQLTEYSYPLSNSQDNWYYSTSFDGNLAFFYGPKGDPTQKFYAIINADNKIAVQRKMILANSKSVNTVVNFPAYSLQNLATVNITSMNFLQFYETSPDYISGLECSGIDYNFLIPIDIVASKDNFQWIANGSKMISKFDFSPLENNFPVDSIITCQQKSICSALKINGESTLCLSDTGKFSASKNIECLKRVVWTADTSLLYNIIQEDDSSIVIHPKLAGKFYLYAQTLGCGLKDSILVTVRAPAGNLNIGSDTILCKDAKDTLNASSKYLNYVWQNGSTDSLFIVKEPGQYSVSVTGYCSDTFSDTIEIFYSADQISAGDDVEICKMQDTLITASSGYSNYQWQPAFAIYGNSSQRTIRIQPDESLLLSVTATNNIGCVLKDTVVVTVTNCLNKIVVPNAFTPNLDGLNEKIKPIVFGVLKEYKFSIYNRWGQLVFSSDHEGEGWDGRYHESLQDTGTFIWVCRYGFYGEHAIIRQGTFLLLR